MDNTLVMDENHLQMVLSFLQRFLPDTPVWAFGSRVSGKAYPWSDLDIVLFSTPEQRSCVSLLREALEESALPFRVDILEWNTLNENFRQNISAHYIPLAAATEKK
ncbi:MAG: nucleotidyltransferase domain-containing protein [Treponemataceae bacterium]|nr:MAG: nucleotidyltransferase domain-containing protein [Treponemataceae bacterium]